MFETLKNKVAELCQEYAEQCRSLPKFKTLHKHNFESRLDAVRIMAERYLGAEQCNEIFDMVVKAEKAPEQYLQEVTMKNPTTADRIAVQIAKERSKVQKNNVADYYRVDGKKRDKGEAKTISDYYKI